MYIGVARLVATYIYSSIFTYVAYHLVRNMQHAYLRAAFSQEIGFFDVGTSDSTSVGSVALQATSNGLLIQAGISEKLGLIVQALSTFVAAFVIAFVSYWKLTLIIICMVPALVLILGVIAPLENKSNTELLQVYGQASSFAENALSGLRTIHAYGLRSTLVTRYSEYMEKLYTLGMKKNKFYGIMFGGQFFVVNAGMGLAFWQGFNMIFRGEVSDIGTVFV